MIQPVTAVSQFSAVPTTTAFVASGSTVPASEADSCRIYGSSYSGVSFGSGFSPDNLLLTDRRPVRSRSIVCHFTHFIVSLLLQSRKQRHAAFSLNHFLSRYLCSDTFIATSFLHFCVIIIARFRAVINL